MMVADVQAGVSFQSKTPRRLLGSIAPQPWNVSPAGDRFLILRATGNPGPPPPFTLVLNWMARLEQ